MSASRDSGLEALKQGNVVQAITLLETAHAEDPADYDACVYLGGAYGQAGRHMDAIAVFTKAVHLQPGSAQARYNLGVAMEHGGFPEQALQVYDQAVQLQHEYPEAHDAIKRLEATSNDGFGAPPPPQLGHHDAHHGHAPDDPLLHAAAPVQQQPVQPFVQPAQQQPTQQFAPPAQQYAPQQPTQQFAPSAQHQPAQQFGAPAAAAEEPGLSNYAAPPPPKPAPSPFGSPGGAAPSYRPAAAPVFNTVPEYEDSFNPIKAIGDCFKAAFTPNKFFSEQVGCESMAGPWGAILFYVLIIISTNTIVGALKLGGSVLDGFIKGLGPSLTSVICWLVYAGLIKMLSSAFGSGLRYGASFRAVVYSAFPFVLMFGISTILMVNKPSGNVAANTQNVRVQLVQDQTGGGMNQMPNSDSGGFQQGRRATGSPYAGQGALNSSMFGEALAQGALMLGLILIGVVWSTGILLSALLNIHEMQAGAAFGTLILADIIFAIVFVGALFVIGIMRGVSNLSSLPSSAGR